MMTHDDDHDDDDDAQHIASCVSCHSDHSEMTPKWTTQNHPRIPPFERVARNTPCLHGRGLGGRVCTDPLCGWLASGISGCVTCHRMVVMMIMMMMDAQHIASCVSCHSEYIDVCTHPAAPGIPLLASGCVVVLVQGSYTRVADRDTVLHQPAVAIPSHVPLCASLLLGTTTYPSAILRYMLYAEQVGILGDGTVASRTTVLRQGTVPIPSWPWL